MTSRRVASELPGDRAALVRHAYRMLGSRSDAEDAVQEAYLRWHAADRCEVREPQAFLRTVVTRICIDMLRSARQRREVYPGPCLPEPVVEADDPQREAELADDISFAFLLTLERLSPPERAAFLLHDVLGLPFEEVASALNRTPVAARQLASRGRSKVRAQPTPTRADSDEVRRLLGGFARALREDDLVGMKRLFGEGAVLLSDGGGKVNAARLPIRGADSISRFFLGIARKHPDSFADMRPAVVNGQPGFLVYQGGLLSHVVSAQVQNGAFQAVYVVANPDKLVGIPDGRRKVPNASGIQMTE